jgi:hypothetical protein
MDMKKGLLFTLIPLLAPALFALELEITGGLGNVAFDTGRTSSLSAGEETFDAQLFPLVRAAVSGKLKDYFGFSGGIERDPLLRNRLFASLSIDLDYVSLEMGPVMGLFNSEGQAVNPGFLAGIKAELPGIFFANLEASSSLGSVLDITGNYGHKSADIAAGFWVPYVICSLNFSARTYAVQEKANLLTEDSLTRYFFRADVYTKNVPYTIRVDLGCQNLKRSYSGYVINNASLEKTVTTDEFKSFFLGLEGAYTFSPELRITLGGEFPVYSWSVGPMKSPHKDSFLFRARTGIIWTLGAD